MWKVIELWLNVCKNNNLVGRPRCLFVLDWQPVVFSLSFHFWVDMEIKTVSCRDCAGIAYPTFAGWTLRPCIFMTYPALASFPPSVGEGPDPCFCIFLCDNTDSRFMGWMEWAWNILSIPYLNETVGRTRTETGECTRCYVCSDRCRKVQLLSRIWCLQKLEGGVRVALIVCFFVIIEQVSVTKNMSKRKYVFQFIDTTLDVPR